MTKVNNNIPQKSSIRNEIESDGEVIFLKDDFFIFEEKKLPSKTLKPSEIRKAANMIAETILPVDASDLMFGYFFLPNEELLVAFASSKKRIQFEVKELYKSDFWLPERYFKTFISNSPILSASESFKKFKIVRGGKVYFSDHLIVENIFNKNFWDAEMHPASVKQSARWLTSIGAIAFKLLKPLTVINGCLFLITMAVGGINLWVALKSDHIQQNHEIVTAIKENANIRKEILAFSGHRNNYFKYLDILNQYRPSEVIFTEYAFASDANIKVTFQAPSLAEAQEYVQALNDSKQVIRANLMTPSATSASSTTFKLEVEF